MFEVVFTIFAIMCAIYVAIFLVVALVTFFYLGCKQLFGDDNEK